MLIARAVVCALCRAVRAVTGFRLRYATPSDALVVAILAQAWRDNVNAPHRFGYATGWARVTFNEKVRQFVLKYRRRHGVFPIGWHRVPLHSKALWFQPPRC